MSGEIDRLIETAEDHVRKAESVFLDTLMRRFERIAGTPFGTELIAKIGNEAERQNRTTPDEEENIVIVLDKRKQRTSRNKR